MSIENLLPRMSSLPLQRFEETGFFSADIRAGAGVQDDFEVEIGSKNPLSQNSPGSGLLKCGFHNPISERELTANIDKRKMAIHCVGREDHSLNQLMGITFQDHAVFACAGFTLVGVAAKISRLSGILRNETPLQACRKPSATAATQPGSFGCFDNIGRSRLLQDLPRGLIASEFDVVIDFPSAQIVDVLQQDEFVVGHQQNIVRQEKEKSVSDWQIRGQAGELGKRSMFNSQLSYVM